MCQNALCIYLDLERAMVIVFPDNVFEYFPLNQIYMYFMYAYCIIYKYIKHTTYNIYVRTYTGVVALGPRQIVRV